jgi:hypothetical protein
MPMVLQKKKNLVEVIFLCLAANLSLLSYMNNLLYHIISCRVSDAYNSDFIFYLQLSDDGQIGKSARKW